jgi:uncharacterized protein
MDYLLISLSALLVAGLTFLSGFGLGTLLLPAFAIFFSVELAVAATAIVHLANNLFKTSLLRRHVHWPVLLVFALPAVMAAIPGALLLDLLARGDPLLTYELAGTREITPAKLAIALLMLVFAAFDAVPRLVDLAFPRRFLPLGGLLSGFFGGLSGHQGALRAAFLVRAGLDRHSFVATSAAAASFVDVARTATYGLTFALAPLTSPSEGRPGLVLSGVASAFAGSLLGRRLLTKVTLRGVQGWVAAGLVLLALALGAGLL